MKKVLSIVISAVMIASLVGCSNSNNNSSEYVAPTKANESSKAKRVTEEPTTQPSFRISKVTVIGAINKLTLALTEWNGADKIGNRMPAAGVWNLTYDENKNIVSKNFVSEDGNYTCDIDYSYDSNNKVLSEFTKTNGEMLIDRHYTYFDNGETESEYYETNTGKKSKTTYDEHGNVLLLEVTSAEGKTSSEEYIYTYDENGNILKCINTSISDTYLSGKSITTSVYTYDEKGNKLTLDVDNEGGTVLNRGYSETWEYDENNNLIHTTSTIDKVKESTITYDSSGNKISRTDINQLTDEVHTKTWEYNEAGKLLSSKTDGVEDAHWTYDDKGNLIKFENSDTTTYEYYPNGKVKNKTVISKYYKQSWTYDEFENLTEYDAEEWQYARYEYKVVLEYVS